MLQPTLHVFAVFVTKVYAAM